MEELIQLGFFAVLLMLGYFWGSVNERRHYHSIRRREKKYQSVPAVSFKSVPANIEVKTSKLVIGSTVISIDYFKRFMAVLYNLVGGRLKPYESLLDRARREAILRMKQSSPKAQLIINVRVETASISKSSRKGTVGSIEVLAYGTAINYK